jgi:hypothetical protein
MRSISYRRILKIVSIILVITVFAIFFDKISDYYFKRPTIVILAVVGIIILIYLIVFFKEIFLRHKTK